MPASNVAAEKRSQPQILVETAGLSEEEWLAYRRKGIGGSDVAALLGISPWRTARDLYFDKLNIVAVEDNEDNWVALEMGHLLEPLVAKIFQHRTGYKVYQIKKMFQHPQYSWMLADVDYFVELPDGSTAILEIKTTNYNARDNWWLNGEETVPVYYETQGRHYMAVMNVDRCFFCCLYGNNEEETIIREIRRDESYEEEMIFLEQYFWENHVLMPRPRMPCLSCLCSMTRRKGTALCTASFSDCWGKNARFPCLKTAACWNGWSSIMLRISSRIAESQILFCEH